MACTDVRVSIEGVLLISSAPVDVHIKGVQPPSGGVWAKHTLLRPRGPCRGVCLDTSHPDWPAPYEERPRFLGAEHEQWV